MSHIDDKWNDLKTNGLNLGPALALEEDAAAGGRLRRYQNGNIYWDSATGAQEVHGGILATYLAHGGPGDGPTGGRELGYPVSDELLFPGPDGDVPYSMFEWGAIFWTPGTGGCVLSGTPWGDLQNFGLGLPLTGSIPVAGGTAIFFDRGVLFWAVGATDVKEILVGKFQPPLLGRPLLIDPKEVSSRDLTFVATWQNLSRATYDALIRWRPSVFTDIWKERLTLAPTGNSAAPEIPLICLRSQTYEEAPFFLNVQTVLAIPLGGTSDIADRTLYDMRLTLANGNHYPLSPHCIYVNHDWDNFGLLHITDLHISQRNEELRGKLQQLGLSEAAQKVTNFQDGLRDFIKYANRLHSLGLADAALVTGDLVDYVAEDGDSLPSSNNFTRLRRILLGHGTQQGSPAGEELRIPTFMTFGNHDYRVHKYDFRFNIDGRTASHRVQQRQYDSHNIIESDAIALQGGKVATYSVLSTDDVNQALRMLQYDYLNQAGSYNYFNRYFSDTRSYAVRLGKHRLVVLDTKYDADVPYGEISWERLVPLLLDALTGNLNPGLQKLISSGAPDAAGFSDAELSLLSNAISEAGSDGLVIVGMHNPAFSLHSDEYPYYLRETLHPTAQETRTMEYIQHYGLTNQAFTLSGTPYFKAGDVTDGLDDGIIAANPEKFLQICAGVSQSRPVDLVLYGHHHHRLEGRIVWDAAQQRIKFYMDFYTENPTEYYHTRNGSNSAAFPVDAPIQVRIDSSATLTEAVAVVRDHTSTPPLVYGLIKTPPYANPLNAAADANKWWQDHRPLFVQTAALGPSDPRQRFGTFWNFNPPPSDFEQTFESLTPPNVRRGISLEAQPRRLPDLTFTGFRLIEIRDAVIRRVHYIALADLRSRNFTMPWEFEWRRIVGHGDVVKTKVSTA